MAAGAIFARLDARDRALFARMSVTPGTSRLARIAWTILTHLGGVVCSVVAAVFPLIAPGAAAHAAHAAHPALTTLVVSHLIVQLVKRTVGRPRPSRVVGRDALVPEPDRFSFPSGHAAASMSVAIVYAVAHPSLAWLLVPLAMLVGASRVCLGVHYPGDVLIGQLIAVVTAIPIVFG